MSHDILISLTARFRTLIGSNKSTTLRVALLQTYLKDFPKTRNINDLTSAASLFFHRQWIRISVCGHLKKVRRAVHFLNKGHVERAEKELMLATLWLGQAEKLYETITFFKDFALSDLDRYIMKSDDLKKGDIVLSYKTSYYLRKSPISWLVKFASNSSVTHVMIASHEKGESPELLFSGDSTHGLGVLAPHPKPGEIFLIMETKDTQHRTIIDSLITTWRNRAQARIQNHPTKSDAFTFPEMKCQVASAIGVLTVLMAYLGRPLLLKNPAHTQRGVFCSELVDEIFKEAGIYIAPRSEYSAIIGPVEFLYSPLLSLKGVIAHDTDLAHVQSEIRAQFITN